LYIAEARVGVKKSMRTVGALLVCSVIKKGIGYRGSGIGME